ncbi:MAG: thiamine phosphate synthase [Hyphomicrobiales bacterium]|nr:thiamine phosphate synthase [Hyphomicrobiales bacterium]
MPDADDNRCRLCLVTPAEMDVTRLIPSLADALGAGDVASVIVTGTGEALATTAAALTPVGQAHGSAVIIHNDRKTALGADGIHVDTGVDDLRVAIGAMRPDRITGAGGLGSRHDAMLAGDADPDYVFFGRLDGDVQDTIFPESLDLAAWWSSIFVIPAMVMGGRDLASVAEAARAKVEFVAMGNAVWTFPEGPAAAVAAADAILDAVPESLQ